MAAVTSVSFSVSTRIRAPSSSSTRVPASELYGIRLGSGVLFGQAECVRASSSSSSVEVVRCVSDGASAAVIDETAEASPSGSEFIDVGYLHDAHGLKGEISIKHATDFPEMRFSKPGKRWLRRKISGREDVQEVELVSGRIHSKHKSWIVKFDGIDDVDQAKQLIGATLLVQEHDRPMLEEGEFYSADLIGMQVILKETGKRVGIVVDVHNYGASDLLRVLLDSSLESARHKSEIAESDPVVWIPFVEAIVPDVDISKKEMYITPPKGLLELNLRSSQSSKKEKRASWKERKAFQRRLIGAKKKLSVMEQQHVFHGLRFGEKPQRDLLAQVICSLNSSLLQKAVESIGMPSERFNIYLRRWSRCTGRHILLKHRLVRYRCLIYLRPTGIIDITIWCLNTFISTTSITSFERHTSFWFTSIDQTIIIIHLTIIALINTILQAIIGKHIITFQIP